MKADLRQTNDYCASFNQVSSKYIYMSLLLISCKKRDWTLSPHPQDVFGNDCQTLC